MRIAETVVVITGASSGIGRATAHAFARQGARLVLGARRQQALNDVAAECRESGASVLVVPMDVSEAPSVNELAWRAAEQFGRVDIWVNAAAVAAVGPVQQVPLVDLRRVLDVNALGAVLGSRAALRHMQGQGAGVVINVSSIAGAVAHPYTHVYGMSKAAVRALGRSLRQELWLAGAHGIHICTVLPTSVATPLLNRAANYTGRAAVPPPPVDRPEHVAEVIVALARSPRREKVTGWGGRALMMASAVAPRLVERAVARRFDRAGLTHTAPATHGDLQASAGTGAAPSARPRTRAR